jgi:hypothetical protein
MNGVGVSQIAICGKRNHISIDDSRSHGRETASRTGSNRPLQKPTKASLTRLGKRFLRQKRGLPHKSTHNRLFKAKPILTSLHNMCYQTQGFIRPRGRTWGVVRSAESTCRHQGKVLTSLISAVEMNFSYLGFFEDYLGVMGAGLIGDEAAIMRSMRLSKTFSAKSWPTGI